MKVSAEAEASVVAKGIGAPPDPKTVLEKQSFRHKLESYRRMSLEIGYLVIRNVFILINLIIFAVVALLIFFGDTREGIVLGAIILMNIILGIIQDVNAWIVLERLQQLTALSVIKIFPDGTEKRVMAENLQKGDLIKLKLGDQVPCDSILAESKSLEISEAIITGESNSFAKKNGENLLAGSVVTAGFGIVRIETIFRESRIAQMTARIKRYSVNASPIQQAVNRIVTYSAYVLIATIAFVILRSFLTGESSIDAVRTVGALSSILVPQGLVVAVTLLFAYGGIHFYRRHVLLREVNATEKLAHIKNLCMDKTGTLTENELTVEEMLLPVGISRPYAEAFADSYLYGSGDSSQLIYAIQDYLKDGQNFENGQKNISSTGGSVNTGEILEAISFSSWRQYGGIHAKNKQGEAVVLAGTPEVFLPYFGSDAEKQWLQKVINEKAKKGKRVFCLVKVDDRASVPEKLSNGILLSPVAVFVLSNNLREGILGAIDFFQKRGVCFRILSGDNTETIRSVAASVGILNPEALITGAEMEQWSQDDYDREAKKYSIFARIFPEQKEKIIEALKKDGFTAMVGDGANDALAIKKADLGIAMFDGTPATRQISAVVLMNNSFAELPNAVRLADSIIEKIEIFSAIFFNQTFIGFFVFIILTALGHIFPFSPLNISFANYFTVGVPGLVISYWAIWPSKEARKTDQTGFLKRIFSFSLLSGIIEAVMAAAIFIFAADRMMQVQAVTLTVLSFIIFGFIFFLFTPKVYGSGYGKEQKRGLLGLALFELVLLLIAFLIPVVANFFDLAPVPLTVLFDMIPVFLVYFVLQYLTAVFVKKYFFRE